MHCAHFAKSIVYVVARTSQSTTTKISLGHVQAWLEVVGYLLAAAAIPWAWLIGLLIPRRDATGDATEINLKIAKQNKSRNIIKYRKDSKSVETPPQTPYKFQPEVTSSPSVTSQVNNTNDQDIDGTKSKRSSYIEAMSTGSYHDLATVHDKKSLAHQEDPLWLTPTHLEQRV